MPETTWESRLLELFDDLEQQAAGLDLVERELELADQAVAEYAQVGVADRLRASVGLELGLRVAGGLDVRGRLVRCSEQWVVLGEDRGSGGWLIPLDAVHVVEGVAPGAALLATASVADKLPLRSLLRRVAESGGDAQVHLRDRTRRDGRLGRIGADFVELVAGEARPGRAAATVVATAAIAAVRWSAW